jgi:tetratricopeptide (TPR) repeat protein
MRAELLYRQILSLMRIVLGFKHPDTLTTINNIAAMLHFQGKYDEAEALYLQAIALKKEVLGPEHPDTLITINNLAEMLKFGGDKGYSSRLVPKSL